MRIERGVHTDLIGSSKRSGGMKELRRNCDLEDVDYYESKSEVFSSGQVHMENFCPFRYRNQQNYKQVRCRASREEGGISKVYVSSVTAPLFLCRSMKVR